MKNNKFSVAKKESDKIFQHLLNLTSYFITNFSTIDEDIRKIGAVAFGIPVDVVNATRFLVMAKYNEHLSNK
jgi:hypothetical protein